MMIGFMGPVLARCGQRWFSYSLLDAVVRVPGSRNFAIDLRSVDSIWNFPRRSGEAFGFVDLATDDGLVFVSDQLRGGIKMAIEAKRNTPGKITRQKRSIRFARFFF